MAKSFAKDHKVENKVDKLEAMTAYYNCLSKLITDYRAAKLHDFEQYFAALRAGTPKEGD